MLLNRSAFYEFDAFRVDVARRLLLRDGEVVPLSPKAFDALVALVGRGGEDVNKADLMRAVWPDTHVEENNLTQAISTLRKALGERRSDHRFVVTLPGRGYRFVAEVREVGAEPEVVAPPIIVPFEPSMRAGLALAVGLLVAVVAVHAVWVARQSIGAARVLAAVSRDAGRASGLDARYTADPATYDAYLRGRFFWNRRNPDGYAKAIALFQEAVGRDGAYAPAYAGLADSYVLLGLNRIDAAERAVLFERAREAAHRAVALDPELAEARTSLAAVLEVCDKDRTAAEREYQLAIALDPGYVTAYQWYGEFLQAGGRGDEATWVLRRAVELDPLSVPANVAFGEHLLCQRRYDQAIAQFERTLELDPNFQRGRLDLGLALEQKQLFDSAIAEFQRVRESDAGSTRAIAALAHVYAAAGRRDDLREMKEEFARRAAGGEVDPYDSAVLYAGLGQYDRAREWLSRARQVYDGDLLRLASDPRLDRLRAKS